MGISGLPLSFIPQTTFRVKEPSEPFRDIILVFSFVPETTVVKGFFFGK